MGLLASIIRPQASAGYGPGHDYWYRPAGAISAAGVPVSAETALKVAAVWACVRLIAESVAMLPIHVYRRQERGRTLATWHPVADVLGRRPNDYQTPVEFFRLMTASALLLGDGLARIVPGRRGAVDQLLPLPPRQVTVDWASDGRRVYTLRVPGKPAETLLDDEVLHVPGMNLDGLRGLSLAERQAVEAIGLSRAMEQYGARFFSQNGRPGGFLKYPGKLEDTMLANIRESWQAMHAGLQNAHQVAVLEEGMEWIEAASTAEEAQFLESRQNQVAEIARWFAVPPHMIGETAKSTSWGSGIEQMSQGFLTYTLQPWLTLWEQRIGYDLITNDEVYYAKFSTAALLRASTLERFNAYQIAAGGTAPWLTVNEVRELEERNPVAGGDELTRPLNMAPAAGQPASAEARPAGHHRLLVGDAAARAARRETGALVKAAERHAGDTAAWEAACADFWGEHAGWLARALHVSPALAERACGAAAAEVTAAGLAALDGWEARRVPALVALTLGEEG